MMRIFSLLTMFLVLSITSVQAQQANSSSDQSRTIQINNENGDLHISFTNGVITEFTVNDTPVSRDRYDNYQEILDEFSGDGVAVPTPPTPPSPPSPEYHKDNGNKTQRLKGVLVDYFLDQGFISSATKFKIQLKSDFLKVNNKKMPNSVHNKCLNLFEEIYGHRLNSKSSVKLKQSGISSSSSVVIVD